MIKRHHERVAVVAAVEIQQGAGEVEILTARNISPGGLFLEVSGERMAAFQPGMRFDVTLSLPRDDAGDDAPELLRARVRVVRKDRGTGWWPSGIGVAFEALDPEAATRLAAHIERVRRARTATAGDVYDHDRDPMSPHGGVLVSRRADAAMRAEIEALARAGSAPAVELDERERLDLELISTGVFSPLVGFLGPADYERVVEQGRLATGHLWPVPVTLGARGVARSLAPGTTVVLRAARSGELLGAMKIEACFERDRAREARQVVGSEDRSHPAVAAILAGPDRLLGGPVVQLGPRDGGGDRADAVAGDGAHGGAHGDAHGDAHGGAHGDPHGDPRALRRLFRARGWRRIVARPSARAPHRGDEYLARAALESADGIVLVVRTGRGPAAAVPDATLLAGLSALATTSFPAGRVVVAAFPSPVRASAAREAILAAIVARNAGCTHFAVVAGEQEKNVVARTLEACRPDDLGIVPVFLEPAFYCPACAGLATVKTCPHPPEGRVPVTGEGAGALPFTALRPEVAAAMNRRASR